jgi:hypothetical protein
MNQLNMTYDFGYSVLSYAQLKGGNLELHFDRVFNWESNPDDPDVFSAVIALTFSSGVLDEKDSLIGKKLESCELYALKVGYINFLPHDRSRLNEITEIRVVPKGGGGLRIKGSNFSIVKHQT